MCHIQSNNYDYGSCLNLAIFIDCTLTKRDTSLKSTMVKFLVLQNIDCVIKSWNWRNRLYSAKITIWVQFQTTLGYTLKLYLEIGSCLMTILPDVKGRCGWRWSMRLLYKWRHNHWNNSAASYAGTQVCSLW